MKIDFSQPILDLSGKPCKGTDGKDSSLSSICVDALLLNFIGEENLPKVEKLKRGKLAEKVYGQAEIDVTVEDAALLQTLVAKAYGPLVVLRADAMLEGGN